MPTRSDRSFQFPICLPPVEPMERTDLAQKSLECLGGVCFFLFFSAVHLINSPWRLLLLLLLGWPSGPLSVGSWGNPGGKVISKICKPAIGSVNFWHRRLHNFVWRAQLWHDNFSSFHVALHLLSLVSFCFAVKLLHKSDSIA